MVSVYTPYFNAYFAIPQNDYAQDVFSGTDSLFYEACNMIDEKFDAFPKAGNGSRVFLPVAWFGNYNQPAEARGPLKTLMFAAKTTSSGGMLGKMKMASAVDYCGGVRLMSPSCGYENGDSFGSPSGELISQAASTKFSRFGNLGYGHPVISGIGAVTAGMYTSVHMCRNNVMGVTPVCPGDDHPAFTFPIHYAAMHAVAHMRGAKHFVSRITDEGGSSCNIRTQVKPLVSDAESADFYDEDDSFSHSALPLVTFSPPHCNRNTERAITQWTYDVGSHETYDIVYRGGESETHAYPELVEHVLRTTWSLA